MKKHKGKILVLFLAVFLVSVLSCENPFLKKMLVEEEKGNTVPAVPENPANPEVPEPEAPKYTITFGVGSGLGTLKAEVDGKEINSGDSVEQGKSVVFTAEPAAGYVVKEWKVDGAVVTGNTENSYIHTVTKAIDVKVSFDAPFVEGGASLILSPDKLTIEVKAVTSDGSAVAVEGCTETTLQSGTGTVLHAKGTRVILKGKITALDCYSNQLTALNVQGLTALQVLDCYENQLTALNMQGCTALKRLWCGWNQLTELNVQGCTALKGLWCGCNRLTELNAQGCTSLQVLDCWNNPLTALNVQGLSALGWLNCGGNGLTALNVQGLTALQRLECGGNRLTELNAQGCTALQSLECGRNQLTELNVQGLTALKELRCYNNQLTALNVQGCTALQELYCEYNQLTALDVQGLTALQQLLCLRNQLTELNVQGCTALRYLDCRNNQLTAQAFIKLFDDLPVRADSDDTKCILYTEQTGVTEGNHTDFTAPPDLADAFNNTKTVKKWKMYKSGGNGTSVEI